MKVDEKRLRYRKREKRTEIKGKEEIGMMRNIQEGGDKKNEENLCYEAQSHYVPP